MNGRTLTIAALALVLGFTAGYFVGQQPDSYHRLRLNHAREELELHRRKAELLAAELAEINAVIEGQGGKVQEGPDGKSIAYPPP